MHTRNVTFSENFTDVLNEWSQTAIRSKLYIDWHMIFISSTFVNWQINVFEIRYGCFLDQVWYLPFLRFCQI